MAVGSSIGEDLGHVVARASGLLLSGHAVEAVLRLLTATAVHTVPAASGAGLTVTAPDGSRRTAAGTSAEVETADAVQYALGEGPCLTAWAERRTVRVDDVARDGRWPRWAAAVTPLGVASTLSAPLVVGDEAVGAIKLYAGTPRAFGAGDEAALVLFAAQAAVLVAEARTFDRAGDLGDDVLTMLRRRDDVAMATGLLMGRDGTTQEAAFARLVALARRSRRDVHEAAAALLAQHRGTR